MQRSKLGTFQGKFYEKNTFHEGGLWEILKFAPLKLFYLYFNQSLRSAILGTEIEIWVGFGRLTRLKKKMVPKGPFLYYVRVKGWVGGLAKYLLFFTGVGGWSGKGQKHPYVI